MQTKIIYEDIKSKMEHKLLHGLSKDLSYHNPEHTNDVIRESEKIAIAEGIHDPEDLFLLKVAGVYHDSGYLYTYLGHEAVGCELAKAELPLFDLNNKQIELICGLIMATMVPQNPHTKMQEIICDADLDYLGRDDFFSKGEMLFLELKTAGIVDNFHEWNLKQADFLSNHQYFTSTNKKIREPQKLVHLEKIKSMINR